MERTKTRLDQIRGLTKEDILALNAQFNSLPEPEKRQSIAREVVMMIGAKQFAARNSYGTLRQGETAFYPQGEMQNIIMAEGVVCTGCAKAAIIAARASLGNDINLGLMDYASQSARNSRRVFGALLADVIEAVYEGSQEYMNEHKLDGDVAEDIMEYSRSLPVPHEKWGEVYYAEQGGPNDAIRGAMAEQAERTANNDRLVAIFTNIADNGGYLVIGKHKFGEPL
jgi:hypothetical protein